MSFPRMFRSRVAILFLNHPGLGHVQQQVVPLKPLHPVTHQRSVLLLSSTTDTPTLRVGLKVWSVQEWGQHSPLWCPHVTHHHIRQSSANTDKVWPVCQVVSNPGDPGWVIYPPSSFFTFAITTTFLGEGSWAAKWHEWCFELLHFSKQVIPLLFINNCLGPSVRAIYGVDCCFLPKSACSWSFTCPFSDQTFLNDK